MTNLPPLLAIIGPTASGKTTLAAQLAEKFQGELINADSRQIYKGMDIATNKFSNLTHQSTSPSKQYFIDYIPLHLIDIITPEQDFSLAQYQTLALQTIHNLHKKPKLPILVGGTGLYVDAVTENFNIPPTDIQQNLRKTLETETTEALFFKLSALDKIGAQQIHPHNRIKIIRALEVHQLSGVQFSTHKKKDKPLFTTLKIGITIDRTTLYHQIDDRVDQMIKQGLVQETEILQRQHPNSSLPAMSGIGYQEISDYLNNKYSLEEAIQKIKYRTHQYARRQITWFKKDKTIRWVENYAQAEQLTAEFLQKLL